MNGIDCIRMSFEMSMGMTMGLVEDIKDSPLAQPTSNGGNHAIWIVGHLAYSEGHLIRTIMLGEDNPAVDLKELFDGGTQPVTDASQYPSLDELIARFQGLRADSLKILDGLSDDDLDTPSKACPDEWRAFFGTYGQCLTVTSLHAMHHRGQLADTRLALGRKPLMG